MAIFGGLVDIGIAFLLAVAFAEYLKFRRKGEKGFNWLILAGIFFLFAGSFSAVTSLATYVGSSVWWGIENIFEILGWIFALVGTLFIAYEALVEK